MRRWVCLLGVPACSGSSRHHLAVRGCAGGMLPACMALLCLGAR